MINWIFVNLHVKEHFYHFPIGKPSDCRNFRTSVKLFYRKILQFPISHLKYSLKTIYHFENPSFIA